MQVASASLHPPIHRHRTRFAAGVLSSSSNSESLSTPSSPSSLSSSEDDTSALNASASYPPGTPLFNGRPYDEDHSEDEEDWDDQYESILGSDFCPGWYKRDHVPASVQAILDHPECTPEHAHLLGNGPAFGWRLPFDFADSLDVRNQGKPKVEWVPLDQHARLRYDRLRYGPRPRPLPADCPFRIRLHPRIVRWARCSKADNPEDYFRTLLMLHTRWTDRAEILHGCSTYEERYLQISERVDARAKFVTVLSDDEIQAAKEAVERFMKVADEEDDMFAADAMQRQEDDDAERADNGEPCEMTILDDKQLTESDQHNARLPQKEDTAVNLNDLFLPAAEYKALIRSLNREQRMFYDHIILLLKSQHIGKARYPNAPAALEDVNINRQILEFLTGGAGVGKSRTISAIRQSAMRLYSTLISAENADGALAIKAGAPTVLMMAFTGCAAFNIRGQTIHSSMGVVTISANPWDCEFSAGGCQKFATKYLHLKFIVIDEVSMMSPQMLRFIDLRFRSAFGQQRPFGGLHVLFVGDLFQIPPITRQYIFECVWNGTEMYLASAWADHVKMFELTQIMRQKDMEFSQCLNRLREGRQTEADLNFFESRVIVREGEWLPIMD